MMSPKKPPTPAGGARQLSPSAAGQSAAGPSSAVDMRPLMASFPTGVAIITTAAADGHPWGMTCTSLCSVSLDPPILLVCLRCGSPTLEAILGSGRFAINLLHDQARSCAELFASGAVDRFDRVRWRMGDRDGGPHLLESAHTIADCTVVNERVIGDHNVIMGSVDGITFQRAQQPLLYGLRRYASWPPAEEGGRPARRCAMPTLGRETPVTAEYYYY